MSTQGYLSSQRGTKRKADGTELPRRITALHEDVVNKIAAGEIIVAPVHALKELMENAVDAGATSLEILVKDGGLKLLQITDNGCGIHKEDLPILCERFTTSKLKEFEDLMSMQTYGFRGEALASISHIAHLTVTTKTIGSECAWKAYYAGGKLAPPKPGQSEEPKPCAGRQGTQIQVEDLFYNMTTRKQAFRSPSEEYAKIAEMVGRYAIHCKDVAFSCKKHGDAGASIVVPASATAQDRIRIVYTSTIANELLEIDIANETLGLKANGFVTNVNYNGKKTIFMLFINHRAVDSSAIRKAIEHTYTTFLPRGGKPFIYLSLEIDPARVDVNVHPTKKEVNFLNEEEIIELVCDTIRGRLGTVDTSRAYVTQSLTTGSKVPTMSRGNTIPEDAPVESPAGPRPTKKPYENNLVRTDAKSQKITALFQPARLLLESESTIEYEHNDKELFICRLKTVKELRTAVLESTHDELTEIIATHTFVGIVDDQKRIAAIQGGVKLYLIDYGLYCAEFFYQLGLTDFGNFGSIRFDPPLDLMQLLHVGVKQMQELERDVDFDWSEVANTVAEHLLSQRAMLQEYFSIKISEIGSVEALPLMLKGYMPSLAKLPVFLLRLGPHVDWTDEKKCFESFLHELASFYVPEKLVRVSPEHTEDESLGARRAEIHRVLENTLFPAFKSRLIATKGMLKGTIEVADLKGLYRVFERC